MIIATKLLKKFTILFILILATGSIHAGDMSDDELTAHINSQNSKFMVAFNSSNISDILELYTKDATFMPANQPTHKGHAAIRAAFVSELGGPKLNVSIKTQSINRHGDTAYEIHNWDMLITLEDQTQIKDNGVAVVIWKRQKNGEWLIHVDIFNSNVPINQ
jgi:uncharacterized protein (TIGR02246 family)